MKKKVDLNLESNDIRNLFKRFSLRTLDSLDIILMWVKRHNMNTTDIAYREVYKATNVGHHVDKTEEQDYIDKINNFDLSEVDSSIENLSKDELVYLLDLIEDALSNMSVKNTLEVGIMPSLLITSTSIRAQIAEIDRYNSDLSDDELKSLFNKYDVVELCFFDTIFEYVYNIDIERVKYIKDKIYNTKKKTAISLPVHNLLDLSKKNNLLTDRELNFLLKIVSGASFYLQTVQELADEFKISDDFPYDEYPIKEIYSLEESIALEQEERLFNQPKMKQRETIA